MAVKYSWDAIVVGFSLEAAIAAALLAKRGWTVAWVGGAPSATVSVAGCAISAAPSLVPSRTFTPALNKVLDELRLLPHNAPLGPASAWQLLDRGLRASMPADTSRLAGAEGDLELLKAVAGETSALKSGPLKLGFFGERAARKRWQNPPTLQGEGAIADAAELAGQIFGLENGAAAAHLLAETHDLPGGVLKLGAMLQRCCETMSVRVFPNGLHKRLKTFRYDWSEVSCTLSTSERLTARVFLFAVPDADVDDLMPEELDLPRFQSSDRPTLLRLALVVRTRGLPLAWGRFAIANGEHPIWIERQTIDREREGCALFWYSDGSELELQKDRALKVFAGYAPFVETHIQATDGPTPVPYFGTGAAPRAWRIARRVLDARGPVLGLRGFEGAAVAGAALAQKVMRLSPRRDPLISEK